MRSWLCVGLDPDPRLLPDGVRPTPSGIVDFCRAVASATYPYAVAFKLNFAFYERLGGEGWKALEAVRRAIPDEVPVIADAKRGDIGNTARAYAEAIFDALAFDAVTLNPYLGWDSVEPFARYEGKGIFVLCKTSNPGSLDLQDLDVGGTPLYMVVARGAVCLPGPAEVGLVVGATYPQALRAVRALDEDLPILAPGVGAQGASIQEAVRAGGNSLGDNLLVAASRSILHASRSADFAREAGRAAEELAAASRPGRERSDATG